MAMDTLVTKWVQDKIKVYGSLTIKKIEDNKLCDEFAKVFSRKISKWTLRTYSDRIVYPDSFKTSKKKNDKNIIKVFESAKYILYIFEGGIYGFDTKEELKTFLQNAKPEAPIRVFENVKAEIKTTVQVLV